MWDIRLSLTEPAAETSQAVVEWLQRVIGKCRGLDHQGSSIGRLASRGAMVS